MEAAYLRAAFPRRRVVLGQVLEPFTLGHAHFLKFLGNGFADDTKKPGPADLIEAVYVCSHSYLEGKRAIESPWLGWKIWLWAKFSKRFDIRKEIAKFQDYVDESSEIPLFWKKNEHAATPGSPLLQCIRITHLAWLHQRDEDVMNKPLALALWDYLAFWEQKGSVNLFSQEDAELIQAAKDMGNSGEGPE